MNLGEPPKIITKIRAKVKYRFTAVMLSKDAGVIA